MGCCALYKILVPSSSRIFLYRSSPLGVNLCSATNVFESYTIFLFTRILLTDMPKRAKWWSWGDAIPRLVQSFVRLGHMLMLGLGSLCCSGSNDSQEIF